MRSSYIGQIPNKLQYPPSARSSESSRENEDDIDSILSKFRPQPEQVWQVTHFIKQKERVPCCTRPINKGVCEKLNLDPNKQFTDQEIASVLKPIC